MNLIEQYFPDISETQKKQFQQLEAVYKDWNSKINVISRKDIDELYLRHVLHSLGISKVVSFKPKSKILDVGTGGGFPGIPLAILFPDSKFHLVDSIGKKLKVVDGVVEELGLKNVKTTHGRAETVKGEFDFIVSRAVTTMPEFVSWVKTKIVKKQNNEIKNGILYLKGGDLSEELQVFRTTTIYNLKDYFIEDFFVTKKVVHLPIKYKG
jgi:16S rRNA (guanine527-N7)-methyltransferase